MEEYFILGGIVVVIWMIVEWVDSIQIKHRLDHVEAQIALLVRAYGGTQLTATGAAVTVTGAGYADPEYPTRDEVMYPERKYTSMFNADTGVKVSG